MEVLRQRLDREYEQLLFAFQKELTRIRTQQQTELEKKVVLQQFSCSNPLFAGTRKRGERETIEEADR
jgi:hypothetical protein